MLHSFPFFSVLAFLCGIACLAVLFVRVQNKRTSSSICRSDAENTRSRGWHFYDVAAAGCVLASFLFIPTGSFPAYVSSEASMPVWFVLYGVGCAGLAKSIREGYSGCALLASPLILGVVYAVCIRYAFLRGFPGNLWNMESMVTMSLYSGADPVHIAGILCLAGATVLHCAVALSARENASFLRACIQIATTQFVLCLFVPVFSQRAGLPSAVGLLADYALHWCLTAVMVLVVYPVVARMCLCRFRLAVTVLSGMGIVLLYWHG